MELIHAMNRGVEKKNLFLDDKDYLRFIQNLYEFNDAEPADKNGWYWRKNSSTHTRSAQRKRERLVDIHGWCLMKNHYHLLLTECREGGLSLFMRKLNVGYAKYFNERYGRKGVLFQGRTKRVHIKNHAHFLHILDYIHLNPLDFLYGAENWRGWRITNATKALQHLSQWRWSSYLDYCGEKNFPSLLSTRLFKEVFGDYKKTLASSLHDLELESIHDLTLE